MKVSLDGHKVTTRKMKPIKAQTTSDVEMAEEMKKPAKEEVRVALKQEPSKVRPIAVTGPIMFQQMDFISDLLEQRLKRSNISTFFMDMRERVETTENLVRACGDPSYLKVPLEQSSFDQHQAILAVKGVFMLATAITKDEYGDVEGAREVADAIDQALMAEMMVKCGTEWKKPWAHGMLSGFRWTGMGDTLLNAGSLWAINDMIEQGTGFTLVMMNLVVQGDDVVYTTPQAWLPAEQAAHYNMLNYEINPNKTYLSKERIEFLERVL